MKGCLFYLVFLIILALSTYVGPILFVGAGIVLLFTVIIPNWLDRD